MDDVEVIVVVQQPTQILTEHQVRQILGLELGILMVGQRVAAANRVEHPHRDAILQVESDVQL